MSDEDSGDEFTNVTKQSLAASAEIRLHNNMRLTSAGTRKKTKINLRSSKKILHKKTTHRRVAQSTRNKQQASFLTRKSKVAAKKSNQKAKKNGQKKNEWINGDFEKTTTFPPSNFKKFRNKGPLELFELMFDDEVFDLLLEETRNYALFCNEPDPNLTKEEIKVFVGILILSGYNKKPGKKFFWDSQSDMGNNLVIQSATDSLKS